MSNLLFYDRHFVLFFLSVFAVYWLLPWHRARAWLLLVASVTFYSFWSKQLAFLVTATTVVDFLIGLGLDSWQNPRKRRLLLTFSLVMNLGLLCYFKYVNFFRESLHALLHQGNMEGFEALNILLPIGISFYTFEAISYTMDVYRRRIRAERNLGHFLLFILFFPHLIAGPIVRGRDFLPQIGRRKHWSWLRLWHGFQLFILGMFKKLVIADHLALYVDPVFKLENTGTYGTAALWLAAIAYVIQIYGDFSGYSDMAIGCAHMLGFKLAPNFDLPYLSANIGEFWRRWHISLSTWLRDYLFIPLGGSRGSDRKTTRNFLLTMSLGGLWHGANWTSIVFGLSHGIWLSGHRLFKVWCNGRPRLSAVLLSTPGRLLCIAGTLLTFTLTLVVFRSASLANAGLMLGRMFVPFEGRWLPLEATSLFVLFGVVFVGHLLARNNLWRKLMDPLPTPMRGLAYAVLLVASLTLTPDSGKMFIYFNF